MEMYDGIVTARAIRRYTDERISDEEIEKCIRAAVQAPNGGNSQPYQFLVVTDPELKEAVGSVYRRASERYQRVMTTRLPTERTVEDQAAFERMVRAADHLAQNIHMAPALVLFLMPNVPLIPEDDEGPMDIGSFLASVYPAVQNFMLAARSMGIGTVLTTVFRIYQNEVRAILGIPDRYEIVALVPMGRPRGRFGIAPRRPPDRMTHWNRFGNKRSFSTPSLKDN